MTTVSSQAPFGADDPRDAGSADAAVPADPAVSTGPEGTGTGTGTVSVSVNGTSRGVPYGSTLEQLVAGFTTAPSGVAAAVNEAVVPRGRWPHTRLADGDRIEVLTAVQGG